MAASISKSLKSDIQYATGRDMAKLIKQAQLERERAYAAGSTGRSGTMGQAGKPGQAGKSGQFGTASQAGTSSYASTFYSQEAEPAPTKKKIDHNITPYK